MNSSEEIKKGFYFSLGVICFVILTFVAIGIGKLLGVAMFELIKPFL